MKTPTRFQEVASVQDYQFMASGHGSSYRFDGEDPHKPTLPNKTLLKTYMEGVKWEGQADTIGGRAQIYRVSTGETISLDEASKIIKGVITENIGHMLEPLTARGLYKLSLEELFVTDG